MRSKLVTLVDEWLEQSKLLMDEVMTLEKDEKGEFKEFHKWASLMTKSNIYLHCALELNELLSKEYE